MSQDLLRRDSAKDAGCRRVGSDLFREYARLRCLRYLPTQQCMGNQTLAHFVCKSVEMR